VGEWMDFCSPGWKNDIEMVLRETLFESENYF
jgi:hypothetical protein